MNFSFEEHGNGYPIVLIHAFPLNRRMWQPQIAPLTAHGYRVILPDLAGFGENTNFSDLNEMESMAVEISRLLDSLKIERAIIGGLSIGGYVLLNLYRLFPQKFFALILCDTGSTADTEEKKQSRFELIKEIEQRGAAVLIEKMLPNLISEDTKQNNPELVAELENTFSAVNPPATIAALRGMALRPDHTSRLSQISQPTLLIFGENDKVTPLKNGERMLQAIPNATLVKIEKAGHLPNLEQPESFNEALLKFIDNLKK